MSLFHTVKQKEAPAILKLIVEISKGDFVKYEYNHEYGVLEVDRVLYGPVHYPVAYCDIPQTWNASDGDPLDAVVYSSGTILPGTLVTGRVVGIMHMEDSGKNDPKIICVNDKDPRQSRIHDINDLPPYELKDLQTFMEMYKYAQTGPGTVKIKGFSGREHAYDLIRKAMDAYKSRYPEKVQ